MQHFLKGFARAAWAGIVSTQFLFQKLIAVNYADSSLDIGFRWESSATLADWQVKSSPFRNYFLL